MIGRLKSRRQHGLSGDTTVVSRRHRCFFLQTLLRTKELEEGCQIVGNGTLYSTKLQVGNIRKLQPPSTVFQVNLRGPLNAKPAHPGLDTPEMASGSSSTEPEATASSRNGGVHVHLGGCDPATADER